MAEELNDRTVREWGERYYEVPEAAALDEDAADAALGGDECVVDVQTHWVAPERAVERFFRVLQ